MALVAHLMGKFWRVAGPAYYPFKQVIARHQGLYDALARLRGLIPTQYPESALAHHYLDGQKGIEIGASAFNAFGLDTLNLNYTLDAEGVFKHPGQAKGQARIDIVAHADALPLAEASLDFVLASHVAEHFQNPIRGLREWYRVIRSGGYLYLIVPHKERTLDYDRPRTSLSELIVREENGVTNMESPKHHSVWITEDFLELCLYLGFPVIDHQDCDDKVGNGFAVVIRKP